MSSISFDLATVFVVVSGGPYGIFAGRDASRCLGKFKVSPELIREQYDDLIDLNSSEMDSIREWEIQLSGTMLVSY